MHKNKIDHIIEDSKELDIIELATKYGVSLETMMNFLEELEVPYIKDESMPPPTEELSQEDKTYTFGNPTGLRGETGKKPKSLKEGDFDNYYKQFKEWLGFEYEPKPKQKKEKHKDPELTIVAGDLHVPYHHEEALKWMIERTSKEAKRLVISGDLADFFSFSRYPKFSQHFTPLEEMKRVQAVLVALSEAYEEVVLLEGNHDARYIKYLNRQGIKPEVLEVFEYLYGEFAAHPVFLLAHGLSNVTVARPIKKDYAEFRYLYQFGDCLVSHAEKFSSQSNKTAEDVVKSIMTYHLPQGLVKDFNVMIQAHTHMASCSYGLFNKLILEGGCLCLTSDYISAPRFLPGKSATLGYTEIYQNKEGITDITKSRFVPYMEK